MIQTYIKQLMISFIQSCHRSQKCSTFSLNAFRWTIPHVRCMFFADLQTISLHSFPQHPGCPSWYLNCAPAIIFCILWGINFTFMDLLWATFTAIISATPHHCLIELTYGYYQQHLIQFRYVLGQFLLQHDGFFFKMLCCFCLRMSTILKSQQWTPLSGY